MNSFLYVTVQMLRREVIKNKPADLEDFIISLCYARLQENKIPETEIGHKGGVANTSKPPLLTTYQTKTSSDLKSPESNLNMERRKSSDIINVSSPLGSPLGSPTGTARKSKALVSSSSSTESYTESNSQIVLELKEKEKYDDNDELSD